jgi:protoporphyrinogen oxidase
MQFVAMYQDNAYVGDADPAHPKTVTVNFSGVTFNGVPIVTVTPKAINGKTGSITSSAVVKETTSSSVTVVINFNTKQSGVAIGLNIIAAGIPNTRV